MKAVQIKQYGSEDQLELVEIPQPKAGRGQVLARVMATSFNPVDIKMTSGAMRQLRPLQFPYTPGVDFSGVVDSVGEGVQQFKPGDEVWGYAAMGGANAEYFAIDADKISAKPKSIGHIEASSLALVGQTALQMLHSAGVQKGQIVLIHGGAGGVGSVAAQAARARGARVIATATQSSANRLMQYGVEQVIDFKNTRFEKDVNDVDVVLDTVGGDVLQRSFSVLKPGGTLVTIVQPPDEAEAAKRNIRASMLRTEASASYLEKLAQMVDAGEIKPFIGRTYSLTDIANAWRDGRNSHIEGKIVFKIAAEADQAKSAASRTATA
jgi:NADPH:quinone reductase-like Zn-dependent oxidoreductase